MRVQTPEGQRLQHTGNGDCQADVNCPIHTVNMIKDIIWYSNTYIKGHQSGLHSCEDSHGVAISTGWCWTSSSSPWTATLDWRHFWSLGFRTSWPQRKHWRTCRGSWTCRWRRRGCHHGGCQHYVDFECLSCMAFALWLPCWPWYKGTRYIISSSGSYLNINQLANGCTSGYGFLSAYTVQTFFTSSPSHMICGISRLSFR